MTHIKTAHRLKKWLDGFKETLDTDNVAYAVLTQKDLFYAINDEMPEDCRVSYEHLDKYADEDYLNGLVTVPVHLMEEWNEFFIVLQANWKVQLMKKASEDSQPYKYYWLAERSFPQFGIKTESADNTRPEVKVVICDKSTKTKK